MGAYQGFVNYFRKQDTTDETVLTLLKGIQTGTERVSKIVKGLNQFSRDTEELNENCDIHSIIDNCIGMMKTQTKHRIQILKNYSTNEIQINGNVGKLHQVFLNIINNAIQAIEKEGIIKINTKADKKSTFIEIQDTGTGISEENLSKITEPFFTTKDPGKGTGLGMSISYTIVKEHKGDIAFSSELGKGTTVILTFPKT
jgi:signal transduction histidine kinase